MNFVTGTKTVAHFFPSFKKKKKVLNYFHDSILCLFFTSYFFFSIPSLIFTY